MRCCARSASRRARLRARSARSIRHRRARSTAPSRGNPTTARRRPTPTPFGAVFQPEFVRNFSISVDYYNIKIRTRCRPRRAGRRDRRLLRQSDRGERDERGLHVDPPRPRSPAVSTATPAPRRGLPQPITNSGRSRPTASMWSPTAAHGHHRATCKLALNIERATTPSATSSRRRRAASTASASATTASTAALTGSILPKFSLNQRTTLSLR